jgi:hypothetical protein
VTLESDPTKEPLSFIGVDPGKTGAIALLGQMVPGHVYDAPKDLKGILALVRQLAFAMPLIAAVEAPTPVPKQGVMSVATLYRSIGWWEAALAPYGKVYRVRPQDWKRSVGFENSATGERLSKAWSRGVAARLYPLMDYGKRSDEGRAEAVLIAHYLCTNHERLTPV